MNSSYLEFFLNVSVLISIKKIYNIKVDGCYVPISQLNHDHSPLEKS